MSFPTIPRRSATVLLAVRNQLTNQAGRASSPGYKLLMLQRSSESKFMPNRFVFPGGVSEPNDFSQDWLSLIGNQGVPLRESLQNVPFYTSYKSELVDSLPAHIAFRICAIRETFEESGVLLVKPLSETKKGLQQSVSGEQHVPLSLDELNEWQQEVMHNASSFIQLCKEINCAPDIWSLYEWSNWVTPAHMMTRFNTMFYFAFLDETPEMSHCGKEVTHSLWIGPDETLRAFFHKHFFLGPPQLMEMARLSRFTTFDDLKELVMSITGVEQIEQAMVRSKSGDVIGFFPADFMFEEMREKTYNHYRDFLKTTSFKDVKEIPLLEVEETTEEFIHTKNPNTYRGVMNSKKRLIEVACNLTTTKHNLPLVNNEFQKFKAMM